MGNAAPGAAPLAGNIDLRGYIDHNLSGYVHQTTLGSTFIFASLLRVHNVKTIYVGCTAMVL